MRKWIAISFAFFCAAASAQSPAPRPVPDRDKTPLRSLCDALAGAERERCIAEEKSRREALGPPERPRSCDDLFGLEKEVCLKQGGRIRAGTDAEGAAGGSSRR